MRARLSTMLTAWPFLVSLVLLLLNDFWLKQAFPGAISGKLSDFAGIALIALLAFAAWPTRRAPVAMAIATAFLWWKSPLSQAFIDGANVYLPYAIHRVVDFTDLVALLALPACAWIAGSPGRFTVRGTRARRVLVPLAAVATVFAVSATSKLPAELTYEAVLTNRSAQLDRAVVAKAVENVTAPYRARCKECQKYSRPPAYLGDLELHYSFPDDHSVQFKLITHDDHRKRMKLFAELREELARSYPELKFHGYP
jgi:hypothetical protein